MIEMSLITSEHGISIIIWPGKKTRSGGRIMGVQIWIFAGLLVLNFFAGYSCVVFCVLSPASFSPSKSPAKRTELCAYSENPNLSCGLV